MLNKINVLEWSLNLRSDKKVKPYVNFNKDINKLSALPDIIFLMESVKDNDFIIENFTKVVESDNLYGNTTTIAIREELIKKECVEIVNTLGHIPGASFFHSPNFAQVDVKIGERIYNLIAVRIKINSKNLSVNEYLQRKKQFEVFMDYVSTLENPIIMGDYNHGRILGCENAISGDIKNSLDHKDCSQVRADYFYQAIKESVKEKGLELFTPMQGVSCGINYVDGFPDFKDNPDWNYKIDHLIVNPENVSVAKILYDWNFLKSAIQGGQKIFDTGCCDDRKSYKKGFPDHAMLLAQIDLNRCK